MRATRRGEQWKECDRCGFDYPLSKLTSQDGLTVCINNCVFEKGAEYYRRLLRVPLERDPDQVNDHGEESD